MVDVKEGGQPHVLALVGRLLETVRQRLLAEHPGLRPSHFRVLSNVPVAGATATELSEVLAMTKQGVGQFVTQLQATGLLDVTIDDADRRRRLVRRTPAGDAVVEDMARTVSALEADWARQVGPERYEVFRAVLREVADVADG